jgi:hypothetical protein
MKNQKDVKAVLIILSEKPGQSVDDLMVAAKLPRTDVANVIKVAIPGKLIERNADDATRVPVYSITDYGRDFLARNSKTRLPKIEQAPAAGSDTPCCNAAKVMATTATDVVAELRADLENARGLVSRLQAENAELKGSIIVKDKRIEQMDAEATYLRSVNVEMAERLNSAKEFLVKVPKRKPRIMSDKLKARGATESAAKAAGRGDVYALIHIGTATRKQVRAIQWKTTEAKVAA